MTPTQIIDNNTIRSIFRVRKTQFFFGKMHIALFLFFFNEMLVFPQLQNFENMSITCLKLESEGACVYSLVYVTNKFACMFTTT